MKRFIAITIATFGLASTALAQPTMIVGEVTRVDTNSYMEQIWIPKTECRDIEVPIYDSSSDETNVGGAVVGAIIGGIIGNQVGNGRGREAATGVGAATGAVIGSRSNNGRNGNIVGYRRVEQCTETVTSSYKEKIRDYQVFWTWKEFSGSFISKRAYSVGDSVKLYMSVSPRP